MLRVEDNPLRPEGQAWKKVIRGSLLDAVTSAGTGHWQDSRGLFPFSITVEDVGALAAPVLTGTFEVRVSNADTIPRDDQDGMLLGTIVFPTDPNTNEAPNPVRVESSFRYVKVKPVTVTQGTAGAFVFGE